MPAILFLCPDNAARGPMAEAITRHLTDEVDAWAAARRPGHVRSQARRALRDGGIDDHGLRARRPMEVDPDELVMVVSLAELSELPPLPTGVLHVHHPLPDPDSAPSSEAEDAYRDTRDALLRLVPRLLRRL